MACVLRTVCHGHERMFEYRDGEVIDGGQFCGWGTANGAEKTIVGADGGKEKNARRTTGQYSRGIGAEPSMVMSVQTNLV